MFDRKRENTRKHKRLATYRLLSYEGGPAGESVFCNLNNISEGGVLFTSPESLEKSSMLQLKILLPHREKAVEGVAEVTRVTEIEGDLPHRFKVACIFTQISDEDRQAISSLVDKASSSESGRRFIDENQKSWRRKENLKGK